VERDYSVVLIFRDDTTTHQDGIMMLIGITTEGGWGSACSPAQPFSPNCLSISRIGNIEIIKGKGGICWQYHWHLMLKMLSQ
jgi:hypothetical protein